ncbi:MAG: phosphatidate cytidylyltransferase [Armatimonadota bacterium]
MLTRTLTALIGIPVTVLLVFLRDGEAFAVAVAVTALVGVHEFCRTVSLRERAQPSTPFAWAIVLVAAAAAWGASQGTPMFWAAPSATLLFMAALAVQMLRPSPAPIRDLGATLLAGLYVGLLLPHLILIRGLGFQGTPAVFTWNSTGANLVLFTLLVTWAADTFAYVSGKTWGKHQLAPKLSPGKTVEGFIAGLLAAAAVGAIASIGLLRPLWPDSSYLRHGVTLGILAGIVGPVGDLCKSAMKRELGVKDFGTAIPGHGGVLDRFDSLMFVAPVAYYYFLRFFPP